jgi:hypothetical protein
MTLYLRTSIFSLREIGEIQNTRSDRRGMESWPSDLASSDGNKSLYSVFVGRMFSLSISQHLGLL